MADQVLILSNPGAGSRLRTDALSALAAAVRARGLDCDTLTDIDAAAGAATQCHAEGRLRALVAAGGDGTVAAAANRVAPEVPLAVYPLGTANLLAGYLQISRNPEAMADMLVDMARVRFDAGSANGRVFLLMASCGFDADVVHRLHQRRLGRHISYWTWVRPLLESMHSYRFPQLRVSCAGPEPLVPDAVPSEPRTARWAFAVNFPAYAGGLGIAPDANPADGLFDVCTFREGSRWHALRYTASVALGRHRESDDYHVTRSARVRIESDEPVPYQLDGDPGGHLPLEIECLVGRLTLVVPRPRALALGLPLVDSRHRGR